MTDQAGLVIDKIVVVSQTCVSVFKCCGLGLNGSAGKLKCALALHGPGKKAACRRLAKQGNC